MRIYRLVRVSQRADQSLYLEHKPNATTDDDYIAISHVWGTPETVEDTVVDGHPGVVKLSPVKRDILSILSRPDICGSDWFWMDLFCIDQTESAIITISDQLRSIPYVYKSARCVKVLLEHCICRDWHKSVMDLLDSDNWQDEDVMKEQFLRKVVDHVRLCGPHMVCFDPWFERLWTRQEGLYGRVLDFVLLNLIPCPREQNQFDMAYETWMAGYLTGKIMSVFLFLDNKLAHDGVEDPSDPRNMAKSSVDLFYRHHLDMAKYGGGNRPAATHDPLWSAWESRRATTKTRDYVLAVFPDLPGYIPPPDMRTMTFRELVANALSQAPVQQRYRIVPKVLAGMMKDSAAMSLRESMAPWIFEEPNNVAEAYDSFMVLPRALWPFMSAAEEKLYCVCRQVTVEDVQLGRAEVPRIVKRYMGRMNYSSQQLLAYSYDPSMGMPRDQVRTERGRVQAYLWRTVRWSNVEGSVTQEQAHTWESLVDANDVPDGIKDVPDAIFGKELRRFLVAMICGTSITTADIILRHASLCVLSTPVGKILAVVYLEEGEAHRQTPQELQLILPPLYGLQGFLVASQTRTGTTTVIGRTILPSEIFVKAIVEEGLARGSVREILD